MAVVSIILGLAGICVCWIPAWGWLGVAVAFAACAIAVPSITRWHAQPGSRGWGYTGIITGLLAVCFGSAFQIKGAGGALDYLVYPLSAQTGAGILALSGLVIAAGLVLARKGFQMLGAILVSLSAIAFAVGGSWTLIEADRIYEQQRTTEIGLKVDPAE